jgi:hypothetical protein
MRLTKAWSHESKRCRSASGHQMPSRVAGRPECSLALCLALWHTVKVVCQIGSDWLLLPCGSKKPTPIIIQAHPHQEAPAGTHQRAPSGRGLLGQHWAVTPPVTSFSEQAARRCSSHLQLAAAQGALRGRLPIGDERVSPTLLGRSSTCRCTLAMSDMLDGNNSAESATKWSCVSTLGLQRCSQHASCAPRQCCGASPCAGVYRYVRRLSTGRC